MPGAAGLDKGVPMRVLLSTIGSRGDVQPLVALASALKTLGQEVRLCVPGVQPSRRTGSPFTRDAVTFVFTARHGADAAHLRSRRRS
jgi:hypothetical protein